MYKNEFVNSINTMFSKYLIVEILSFIYNIKQTTKICLKMNNRMRKLALCDKNIIKNICRD